MPLTSTPVFPQTPNRYAISIGTNDSTYWKLLESGLNTYAPTNGTDILSLTAASTDSAAKVLKLAIAGPAVSCTFSVASPTVVTAAMNVSQGDIIVFTTTGSFPTLGTGTMAAGVPYYVLSGTITAGTSFGIAPSASGTPTNVSVAGSNCSAWLIRPKSTFAIPASSGFDTTNGVTPSIDLLNSAVIPGLAFNNDGKTIIRLKGGQAIAVSLVAATSTDKVITVGSAAVDY